MHFDDICVDFNVIYYLVDMHFLSFQIINNTSNVLSRYCSPLRLPKWMLYPAIFLYSSHIYANLSLLSNRDYEQIDHVKLNTDFWYSNGWPRIPFTLLEPPTARSDQQWQYWLTIFTTNQLKRIKLEFEIGLMVVKKLILSLLSKTMKRIGKAILIASDNNGLSNVRLTIFMTFQPYFNTRTWPFWNRMWWVG